MAVGMINQKQKRCGVYLLDRVELKKPNRKCASTSELSVDQYKRTGLGQRLTMSSIKKTCGFNPHCPGVDEWWWKFSSSLLWRGWTMLIKMNMQYETWTWKIVRCYVVLKVNYFKLLQHKVYILLYENEHEWEE